MTHLSKSFISGSILLTLIGGGMNTIAAEEPFYTSADAITLEKIEKMSAPVQMLAYKGGVKIEFSYQGTGDENLDNGTSVITYLKENDIIYSNQLSDYADGLFTHLYFSNDENDPYLYLESNGGVDKSPFTIEEAEAIFNESLFGFSGSDAKLLSVSEEDGNYVAKAELYYDGTKESEISITLDPATGYPLSSETVYYTDGEEDSHMMIQIDYSSEISIDDSPKTAASGLSEAPSADTLEAAGDLLSFNTEDIDGNAVTDEIIKDVKVVMVNFWEPWCGPCVGEMPELEELYEAYKDQGLLIIGVFATPGMDEDAKAILDDCGITYPVIRYTDSLEKYTTDYVPTTIFADGTGKILTDEPIIGANSYADWEAMIKEYLE